MVIFFANKIVWAQPISVGALVEQNIGATWVFPVHQAESWYVALGQQNDLWLAPLDSTDWTVNMEEVRNLSNHGQLIDHSLRPCPDGSWLHVGFSGFEQSNSFWFYDEQFELSSSGEIDASSNDPSTICGRYFKGSGTAEMMSEVDLWWPLDNDASGHQQAFIELLQSPRLTGAGMLELNGHLFVVGRDLQPDLVVQEYDVDFQPVSRKLIPSSGPGIMNYWPTAVELVGDKILLLTMGRDPADPWLMDSGNLYLAVLNLDWEIEMWEQLTDFVPEEGGGMRPWMDRDYTTLLVGFDRNNQGLLIPIELDEAYFGLNQSVEEVVVEPSSEPVEEGCRGDKSLIVLLPLCFAVGRFKRP